MNSTTKFALVLIGGGALAGCHHRQAEPVYTTPTETVVTTTTTTSTTMPDTMTSSSSSSMSTSSTGMSSSHEMRGVRGERHEVRMAIASIERARRELERAGHDYGGRKAEAMKATSAALHELHMASGQELREERTGRETATQERVQGRELHLALVDLERARADMEHARHDFNGRRREALESVDAAIRELRAAAEYEK